MARTVEPLSGSARLIAVIKARNEMSENSERCAEKRCAVEFPVSAKASSSDRFGTHLPCHVSALEPAVGLAVD